MDPFWLRGSSRGLGFVELRITSVRTEPRLLSFLILENPFIPFQLVRTNLRNVENCVHLILTDIYMVLCSLGNTLMCINASNNPMKGALLLLLLLLFYYYYCHNLTTYGN